MRLYFERHFHEHRLAVSVLFDQKKKLNQMPFYFSDRINRMDRIKLAHTVVYVYIKGIIRE